MLQAGKPAPGTPAEERAVRLHALVVELLGILLRAPNDQTDAAIDRVLSRVGMFCDVDRAYVFRNRTRQGVPLIDNTHEWCAAGIAPSIHLNRDLPEAMIDPWRVRLEGDAPVEIWDVDALPQTSPEKAHLQAQGIRSLLAVPMRAGGRFSGFVGFDAVRGNRVFPAGEVALLKSVADAVGATLARADADAEIARTRDSLAAERRRLQATLNALPDLILEVDAEGRYRGVHTVDPGQMAVPPDSLVGRTHEEVVPPELAALNRRAMAEATATGRSGPHPFDIDTPRGPRRYALTVTTRPPMAPDEPPDFVFFTRDITEESRLQRESERLSLIARRMTDLVMVLGLDNRIEWVNPAFEARTGWPLHEVRGRTPPEILHAPGTDPAEIVRIGAEMAAGRPVRAELLNRARDGEEFWTEVDMHPLHDAEGQPAGYVSIETDITERKRQAATLEQLARQATEARARLEMAVEALPDAFAYFDADDRLVLCNRRYREFYPNAASLMVPGARFADIARAAVQHGEVPVAVGHEEEWLAERLRRHASPGEIEERRVSSGRWLRVVERATPDGGRVGMRIDITELKQAEQRLADIIQGAEAGTWEWTVPSGQNLINSRWAEIVGHTLDELTPLTIDVWRRLVHPDDLAEAEAKLARVFARELDQFEYELRMRHKAGHWVWVMSRGRVSRWSPEGAPEVMAGVHIDITALKHAEERLEQIIEAADAGTWELDFRAGQTNVSERWAGMLGFSRDELAGRPDFGFRELVHPDDMAMLDRMHAEEVLQGRQSFTNEIRMRHRAGHWVWVLSRGQVVAWDAVGRPAKAAGIHLDITERKRLEAELTAERDYLSRLMETSVSGITALDAEGRITFANREAERILGLPAAGIVGRVYDAPDWSITTLDGGPMDSAALPFALVMATGGTVRDVRFAIGLPDGTRRLLSVNAAPLAAEGSAARVVCSIADITAQVEVEAALRSAAERAEAASRAKSRFLANMSHEIRTPLNGVLGMAEVLAGQLSDPGQRDMLATIRDSGEVLLGVLNDILDMSKIEAGKLTLETVPIVPEALVRRICALHSLRAEEKGLRLTLEVAPEAAAPRLGDPQRLQQVLHNLIGNAVKFTERGGVVVRLGLAGDGGLVLGVCDSGIGMTPGQLARVFEDFEQADGSVTRRFGGTGLGMSIVRRLVGLMGGAIEIDSVPGAGTEVRVRLPLPPAPRPATAPPMAAARRVPEAALAGKRALAADDNATNRLILQAMLASLGMQVTLVDDGRAALEAWEPGRFDVLLLDISMPEMDGISALAAIRARAAGLGVRAGPAVAITANAMAHQVSEYLAAGFDAHVGKPFRREDLAAAIAGAITG